MNDHKRNDINDNEIRIISGSSDNANKPGSKKKRLIVFAVAVVVAIIVNIAVFMLNRDSDNVNDKTTVVTETVSDDGNSDEAEITAETPQAYATARDTIVDGNRLTVITPVNAVASLATGNAVLSDRSTVVAVQAADIREDNGEIAGTFVIDGELIGRGQSKTGFCAIIDGQISIGVASETPLMEKAIETGGDFFRQYALVIGTEVIDNKPKGRSNRKALAMIDGVPVVVISESRLTYREFSELLTRIGVSDAIALVGASAYAQWLTETKAATDSLPTETSITRYCNPWPDNRSVNYIVWSQP